MKKPVLIFCGIAIAGLGLFYYSLPKTKSVETQVTYTESDRRLGSPDAPIKIIEYASFSCSHCSDFSQKTFPSFKKDYIETGKVEYALRLISNDSLNIQATALAYCLPNTVFYDFADSVFKNYTTLIKRSDPKDPLEQIASFYTDPKISSYSTLEKNTVPYKVKDCLQKNHLLMTQINQEYQQKARYTPTFFVQKDSKTYRIEGNIPYEKLKTFLESPSKN